MSQRRTDRKAPAVKSPATTCRRGVAVRRGALAAALAVALLTATPAWSQRELYWRELTVEARLDRQGVLHVREIHDMVMTGDWNGGERVFRPRMPGTVKVQRVTRIDETEREIELERGDLAEVDHWSQNGNSVRWRSRLPSDPEFDHTELRYRIDYRMSHVLVRRGDLYRLDHDFAFPDRGGEIERFELDLELDPEWQLVGPAELRQSRQHLAPGETHVVFLELRVVGDAAPAKVLEASPPWLWRSVAAGGGLLILAFFVDFRRREAATGRMARAEPLERVDEGWLDEHVFSSRPEVVGGIWDQETGAPEVAATIARLVVEGKLTTDTERRGWLFKRTVLELERKVDFDDFAPHDESLMRGLFFGGRRRVDTDEIREHYAETGFRPIDRIRSALDLAVQRQLPPRPPAGQPRYLEGRWYWLAGLFFALVDLVVKPGPLTVWTGEVTELHLGRTTGVVALALVALGVGSPFAAAMRSRVVAAGRALWLLPLLAILVLVLLAWFRFSSTALQNSPASLLAGALATLAVCVGNALIWMNRARTPLSAAGVARRRELVLARRWFRRELRRPKPRLKDDWFPYLVGLGLGDAVDRWFRGFGGAAGAASVRHPPSSSISTSWSGGGGTWTGGGGRFGGAGATSAWAVAATAVGGGVSEPSSSGGGGGSSGGGSSGGGSSGGGSGGGW